MRKIAVLILQAMVASLIAPGALAASPAQANELVITHVNVIDATGSPLQPDRTVVIRKGIIVRIKKSSQFKPPEGATVVDAQDKFLIPGLWDMHVHTIFGDWIPGGKEVSLPLFLANGVTGVRDMGGDLDILLEWRREISAGTLQGPTMVVAGPMLDGPKSHFPASVSIASPEEGRKAVDDLKAHGADFIKVQSYIQRDAYFAVADEARKQRIIFVGHVPDAIRASEAIDAGQKSVEHLTGIFEGCSTAEDEFLKGSKGPKRYLDTYDSGRCASLIAHFARKHTWLVPMLVWERGQWLIDDIDFSHDPLLEYAPQSWQKKSWPSFTKSIMTDLDTDDVAVRREFVHKEFEIIGAMHRAGVRLMAGTDTAAAVDVLPGFSLHQELECLVEAGLSPMEALQTATRNPAIFLGLKHAGTVQKGNVADLVLLDANPLSDIRNTRKIRAVIKDGKLLTRGDLDEMLRQVSVYAAAH